MIRKLSARQAATFKGPGKLGDGGGLWVRVTPAGGRFWFLRYRFQGRYREMGLGSADDVGLREAREGAARARRLIREGLDPIAARRQQRAKAAIPTFAACAERFLSDNEGAWNNATHRAQWRTRLETGFLAAALADKRRLTEKYHPDRLRPGYDGETQLLGSAMLDRTQAFVHLARYDGHLNRRSGWFGGVRCLPLPSIKTLI